MTSVLPIGLVIKNLRARLDLKDQFVPENTKILEMLSFVVSMFNQNLL